MGGRSFSLIVKGAGEVFFNRLSAVLVVCLYEFIAFNVCLLPLTFNSTSTVHYILVSPHSHPPVPQYFLSYRGRSELYPI